MVSGERQWTAEMRKENKLVPNRSCRRENKALHKATVHRTSMQQFGVLSLKEGNQQETNS